MTLCHLDRSARRSPVREVLASVTEITDVVADRGALQPEGIADLDERAPFAPKLDEFAVALSFGRPRFSGGEFRCRQRPDRPVGNPSEQLREVELQRRGELDDGEDPEWPTGTLDFSD